MNIRDVKLEKQDFESQLSGNSSLVRNLLAPSSQIVVGENSQQAISSSLMPEKKFLPSKSQPSSTFSLTPDHLSKLIQAGQLPPEVLSRLIEDQEKQLPKSIPTATNLLQEQRTTNIINNGSNNSTTPDSISSSHSSLSSSLSSNAVLPNGSSSAVIITDTSSIPTRSVPALDVQQLLMLQKLGTSVAAGSSLENSQLAAVIAGGKEKGGGEVRQRSPVQCGECGRVCSTPAHLNNHIR